MSKKDEAKEEMGITKQLAEFVCGHIFESIPPRVVILAKSSILDCMGVALFGSSHFNSKKILSFVRSVGGDPQASVFGSGFKTSTPWAALANGYMAHVADWDDTIVSMRSHPSATILPTVLAVGES